MNRRLLRLGTPLLLALSLTGCHRDMYDQPYKRSLAYTPVFTDHASSRPIVPHTVSQEDPEVIGPTQTGDSNGQLLIDLPVPITKELLARGQERYNIYCSVCHGTDGYGDGMIVQRGFPKPPSFHSDRLRPRRLDISLTLSRAVMGLCIHTHRAWMWTIDGQSLLTFARFS